MIMLNKVRNRHFNLYSLKKDGKTLGQLHEETGHVCFYPFNDESIKLFIFCHEPRGAKGADHKFIRHIQAHLKPGEEVICKICGKTVKEIDDEIS